MSLTRKEIAIRSALIFMGVFTTTPALAVINPAQLESYGVIDPNSIVLTLLQHRGLLQFALGASLVYAAFKPDIRVAAALAAIFTKGGGLLITYSRPEVFAEASQVAMVFDPLCIVLLAAILVDIALQRGRYAGRRPTGA
ncbi:MAG: hypothetical protein EOR16_30720 [Mesorhizobium sp.]|uniref:hypothetical protein n=1 Tax=Mesorhizobium sp. TaxID=1871066 RepID=UPI000FE55093|nr:hypothetical protein [Mesorhizobium sp.]RWI50263.1 MAG: hypothetical protein EOR16_30720 [Mesorhizobium sp.]